MDYYDLMANGFDRRGYEPYPVCPTREKSKEDLILEKLDAIMNLLNEQNLVNQEIGNFMEVTRKISDITEMRISDLENKVNNLEILNNDSEMENRRRDNSLANLQAGQSRIYDRGFLLNTLGIRFNGDGSITWK